MTKKTKPQTLADLDVGDRFIVETGIFSDKAAAPEARVVTHRVLIEGLAAAALIAGERAWDATGRPLALQWCFRISDTREMGFGLGIPCGPGFGRARVALPGELEALDEKAAADEARRAAAARAEAEAWVDLAECVAAMPLRERVGFLKAINCGATVDDLASVAKSMGGE